MINPQSQAIGSDTIEVQGAHSCVETHEPPISAGMILRQARESAGLHIAALAVALKVPVKKLEALEMDRYDLLPDTVFARALASSVCRTLKVNAVPVLALLPQSAVPLYRTASVTAQGSFSAYPFASRPPNRSSVSGPALMAGLLLMAGAAMLIFLPTIKQAAASFNTDGLNSDRVLGVLTGTQVGSSAGGGGGNNVILSSSASPHVANTIAIAVASNLGRDVAPSSAPILPLATTAMLKLLPALSSVSEPIAAVSPPAGLSRTAEQSSDRLVTFSAATQSSWVKVTDAKGAVVLSRTIAPGEAVFAAGALPLSVVVGRADATRVQVRGQVFDLAAYSRENVARFEVK